MKLTLTGYGVFKCGNDVLFCVLPSDENDSITIKCSNKDDAWRIYSTFGKIEIDTQFLFMETSNISEKLQPCIDYNCMKFTPSPR